MFLNQSPPFFPENHSPPPTFSTFLGFHPSPRELEYVSRGGGGDPKEKIFGNLILLLINLVPKNGLDIKHHNTLILTLN